MSAIVTKYYNKVFRVLIDEHGFKKKSTLFYRLKNDKIVQTISLFQSSFGHAFSIEFDLFPVCTGIESVQQLKGSGLFRIGRFTHDYDYWWEYANPDENEVKAMVSETLTIVEDKVLPLFEKVVDEETYRYYVPDLERKFYGAPLDDLIWINLKLRNYYEVLKSIEQIEKQNYDSAALKKSNYENEEEYHMYLQEIENDLSDLRSIKAAIQKNDTSYLESILRQNEEKSKQILEKIKIL
ncbi:MAG: DUF4304 domain-containing protein [Bacteroidaceae bacterium]|nr:DUF4304 domain-containing protein [Bacteroidaceae bacterium]